MSLIQIVMDMKTHNSCLRDRYESLVINYCNLGKKKIKKLVLTNALEKKSLKETSPLNYFMNECLIQMKINTHQIRKKNYHCEFLLPPLL